MKKIAIVVGCAAIVAVSTIVGVFFYVAWRGGGARSDFYCELQNGYTLARTNAADCYVLREGKYVVPPNIQEAGYWNHKLFGYATRGHSIDSVEGYFFVDVRTREAHYGLGKQQWLSVLATNGIGDYVLVSPRMACAEITRARVAEVESNARWE